MPFVKLSQEGDRPVRIGVALGGGSARGYAHLGALASLERHGHAPTVIVGTSFGAVVGALYATGKGIDELCSQANAMRRRDVFPHVADFGLHRAALFRGDRLQAYFERLLEGRHFADLDRPLVVVTTDIDSGERVLLSSGPLDVALRASASLPGIFAPVEIDGRRLIDGGIGSPVPLDTLVGLDVDLAIGIGAGMEARDSQSIRAARRLVARPAIRRVHSRVLGAAPRGAVGRLGRAIAIAAQNWLDDESLAAAEDTSMPAGTPVPDGTPVPAAVTSAPTSLSTTAPEALTPSAAGGGCDSLEVHTRPPIHWLNFHRAGEAISAGDAALSAMMPRVKSAVASVLAARTRQAPGVPVLNLPAAVAGVGGD